MEVLEGNWGTGRVADEVKKLRRLGLKVWCVGDGGMMRKGVWRDVAGGLDWMTAWGGGMKGLGVEGGVVGWLLEEGDMGEMVGKTMGGRVMVWGKGEWGGRGW